MSEPKEIWRGVQWSVKENGDIDQIEEGELMPYWILGSDLRVGTGDLPGTPWPVHMAEKRWVLIEEFIEAYRRACAAAGIDVAEMEQIVTNARRRRQPCRMG